MSDPLNPAALVFAQIDARNRELFARIDAQRKARNAEANAMLSRLLEQTLRPYAEFVERATAQMMGNFAQSMAPLVQAIDEVNTSLTDQALAAAARSMAHAVARAEARETEPSLTAEERQVVLAAFVWLMQLSWSLSQAQRSLIVGFVLSVAVVFDLAGVAAIERAAVEGAEMADETIKAVGGIGGAAGIAGLGYGAASYRSTRRTEAMTERMERRDAIRFERENEI